MPAQTFVRQKTPETRIASLRRVTQGLFDHEGYIGRLPTTPIGPIVDIQTPSRELIPAYLESTFADLEQDAHLVTCKTIRGDETRHYLVPASATFEIFALPFGRQTVTLKDRMVTGTVLDLQGEERPVIPHNCHPSMHADIAYLRKERMPKALLISAYSRGQRHPNEFYLAPIEATQVLGL